MIYSPNSNNNNNPRWGGFRRKKFNPELFALHDARARAAACQYFSTSGGFFEVIDNPDQYGIDLLAYEFMSLKAKIEVEVREVWKPEHKRFPFPTVHILQRKLKFFEGEAGVQTLFCAFRSDLVAMLVLDLHDQNHPVPVAELPVGRVAAKGVGHVEGVVDVPLAYFQCIYTTSHQHQMEF